MFLMGFCAFLLQLRLLYVLRYIKMIATLSNTLTRSATKLLSVGFIFIVVFLAFCTLLYGLYGTLAAEYGSFVQTAKTMVILAVGYDGFEDFIVHTGRFGIFVSLLYSMTILFIVTNLFVVILLDFLDAMQKDREIHKDNEVIDYIINLFKDMLPGEKKSLVKGEIFTKTKCAVLLLCANLAILLLKCFTN